MSQAVEIASLKYVFGVVKQNGWSFYEKNQGKSIVDFRYSHKMGLDWILFCKVHCTSVRELVSRKSLALEDDEKDVEFLIEQSHGLPSTSVLVAKEFVLLYYLGTQLVETKAEAHSIQQWWSYFYASLERVHILILKNKPTFWKPTTDACLSLVEVLLLKPNYLLQENIFVPFACASSIACCLLLVQNLEIKAKRLATRLANLASKHVQRKNPTDSAVNCVDLIHLVAACCCLSNSQEGLSYLDSIHSFKWKNYISYFKVYLLHEQGKYKEALSLVENLVTDQYTELETELKSPLCISIAICLADSGLHNLAIDWFGKSLNEDPDCLVVLWYISREYRRLGNSEAEQSALTLLVQASRSSTDCRKTNVGFAAKDSSSVCFSEALYILSSRLISLEKYKEASEVYKQFFESTLSVDDDTNQWIITPKPSPLQVHVEAAYAALHATLYDNCLEHCELVLKEHPEATDSELNSRSNCDLLDICEESYRDYSCKGANLSKSSLLLVYLIRAVAMMHLQQEDEGMYVLRRLLCTVTMEDTSAWNESPPEKKAKLDKAENYAEENGTDRNYWKSIISQTYCNLAVMRLKKELKSDALHSLRVSLMIWPDNLDSLYNYVVVLLQISEYKEAADLWKKAKSGVLCEKLLGKRSCPWEFNVTPETLETVSSVMEKLING